MKNLFLSLAVAAFLSPSVSARTIESVVEDVTWDLLFVVRPVSEHDDIPTETLILFTEGVYTPSLASASFENCRLNKKQLKPLEDKLRTYIGANVVTTLAPDSKPVWFGEGYRSAFVYGEHVFDKDKSLQDIMLENEAAVTDPEASPAAWWRKPKCMDKKR